jgi:hypothetical protein
MSGATISRGAGNIGGDVLLDGEHAGRLKARAGFEAAVAEAVTTFGPAKPRGSDSRF